MKTTHAVWERENLGVDAYEIALDASDTPDMLRQEEARIIAAGAEYIVAKPRWTAPRCCFRCRPWAIRLWRRSFM